MPLTNDVVSSRIMEFIDHQFLYTGLVCKSWSRNTRIKTLKRKRCGEYLPAGRTTEVSSVYGSPSRFVEAVRNGLSPRWPFFDAIRYDASISVIEMIWKQGFRFSPSDISYASGNNRVDILRFFCANGSILVPQVLHAAVRHGHTETVRYLLDHGCPMDVAPIDWSLAKDELQDGFKIRSLELAIRSKYHGIIRELCEKGFPSNGDTFLESLNTRDAATVDLVVEMGIVPDGGTFKDAVIGNDLFTLRCLLKNKLMVEEWGLYGVSLSTHRLAIHLLLDHGVIPTEEDMVNCILKHDLATAMEFERHGCNLPGKSFEIFVQGCKDKYYTEYSIDILDWFYYDHIIEIDEDFFDDYRSRDDSIPAIVKWFEERL